MQTHTDPINNYGQRQQPSSNLGCSLLFLLTPAKPAIAGGDGDGDGAPLEGPHFGIEKNK